MADELTLEELARRTGEPLERLRQWQSLGLIGRQDRDGFTQEDAGRARLIHDLLHHGMSLEAIAEAARQPNSVFRRYLDELGAHWSRQMYSLAQVSEILGLEIGLLQRLMDAAGIRQPGEMVDEDDLEFFRASKEALDAGYPEEALLQVLRVYSDALERVAEAEARTTHVYMHERLKAEGLSGEKLMQTVDATASRIGPLVEPAILYFHRKGAAKAAWEDMLTHLEEEAGLLEGAAAPGQLRRAVMFVDLASFTPLAEAMGDVKAAQVLQRFAALVRMAVNRYHGRVVKQIGDAFMLVFTDPQSAVACALEIEAKAEEEPQFPAVRSGAQWGPVLYREGDYLGSNVNIASRLAAEAQRHQVLVTAAVRNGAKGLPDVEFVPLGKRRLKGLAADVEVFEARRTGPEAGEKVIDPVCGMELGPGEIAARLSLEGQERAFCSDECLRRFVASPERYP